MAVDNIEPRQSLEVSLDMDSFFPYQLTQLQSSVSDNIAEIYTGHFELTRHEWRILAVLGTGKALSAKQIGLMINLEKMQTSRALARMINKALIAKVEDRSDKRSSLLKLTPEGLRVHRELAPMVLAREQALLSVLSEDEHEQLKQIMDKLFAQSKAIQTQAK
ncbi:transcriptional regulatory protein [Shewanella sediminis HAW-EB3]|uniref:Transcriptional regulatory protein n=1 Tax=Shewanella sediminis (strain HAW-EB3) TaxID=425104 RepID=A8G0L3_SHESH|nr:winged helix DNA-binding protein [Shewanella sediminis]ABV38636.1 transcriptional regulatory protein [Shewanella sediminis HAW-EB3]